MQRRNFLYKSGLIITAAALSTELIYGESSEKPLRRPNPTSFKEPVLKGIAYGINATNPHNTQAWKFKLISESEMLFFADKSRFLLSTDPTTRQIHIGCGCFLECMRLGMMKAGYQSEITFFPMGKYKQSSFGKEPIASIKFTQNSNIKADTLSDAIFDRKTSRLKYDEEKIESHKLDELLEQISPKYSSINLINEPSKLSEILPVLYRGMEVETYTYRTHDESRKWFRQNDDLIAEKRDGINLAGGGTTGIFKWLAEWQLRDLEASKWHNKNSNAIFLKKHKEKVLTSKGILILKTKNNTPEDWVYAGLDYMRLSLAFTQSDYYLHPLSQVLQEFDEMKKLRLEFEKIMKIHNPQKIQMAVRVGKSSKPFHSYRRFLKDFVL